MPGDLPTARELVQIEVTEAVMEKLFADFAQIQDPTSIDDMMSLAQTGTHINKWYTN